MQAQAQRRSRIRLFAGGLTADERALTGVEVAASVEEAVLASVRRTDDPRVAVIPEGPYVVPMHAPA